MLSKQAMPDDVCSCPSDLSVLRWIEGDDTWQKQEINSHLLHSEEERWRSICTGSSVAVVLASAKKIRACPACRRAFSKTFCMPAEWWSKHLQQSNGFVGFAQEQQASHASSLNTWACFETKQLSDCIRYEWFRVNIFTRWTTSKNQIVVLLLNVQPPSIDRLLESLMQVKPDHLDDPLWVYADITNELVYLEDVAVWAIRDQVRAIETDKKPVAKPEPDYRRLHDLARHAIHVTETLDVTMHTMEGMLLQHQELRSDVLDEQAWRAVHQRLLFSKQMVGSLQYRSRSNQERLQNEIQLSFNIVTQYDSGVSVKIAQAAKADSAAMKTISLLTLAFLPPTFICAIFSMSFFNYSANSGWIVSGRIWIYFVFAIPLTLTASVVCYLWQRIFPAEQLDQPDIHLVASA